jgi:hypothetical protein
LVVLEEFGEEVVEVQVLDNGAGISKEKLVLFFINVI